MMISKVVIGTSRATLLKHWIYSHKHSRLCFFSEKRLNVILWYCLLLKKWCRIVELNSSKEWMDRDFS